MSDGRSSEHCLYPRFMLSECLFSVHSDEPQEYKFHRNRNITKMVLAPRNKVKAKATNPSHQNDDSSTSSTTSWCVSRIMAGDEAFRNQDYQTAISKYIESIRMILPSQEFNSDQLTIETMSQYCVAASTLLKLYAVYCKNKNVVDEDAQKSLHSAKALIEKVLSNVKDDRNLFQVRVSAFTLYSEIMEAQGDIYYANQDYTNADEIYHKALNCRQQSIEMIEAQENFEKKKDSDIGRNSDDLEETTVFPSSKSLWRDSTSFNFNPDFGDNNIADLLMKPNDNEVVKGQTSSSESRNDVASSISGPRDIKNKKPTAEATYAFNQEYESGLNDLRQCMSRTKSSRSRVTKLKQAMKKQSLSKYSYRNKIARSEVMNTPGANFSRPQSQMSLNQVSLSSDELSIHSSTSNTPRKSTDQGQGWTPLPYK